MTRILIIDDNLEKTSAITSLLRTEFGLSESDVAVVSNLSDAVGIVNTRQFDLIVLDFMLPYIGDSLPDSKAGVELLRQIRQAGPNQKSTVLGLSAFPEELEAFRPHFSRYGVLITSYDESSEWQSALSRVVASVIGQEAPRERLDFLIFVALEEERAGVLRTAVEGVVQTSAAGLNVTMLQLAGEPPLQGAMIKCRQMGLVASTLDVSIALSIFEAPIVCMTGICAGFAENVHLGQIIVASPAWEYQAGKWSKNGFEIAPAQIPLRPLTRLFIEQSLSTPGFLEDVEKGLNSEHNRPVRRNHPTLGPAASGSSVIADAKRLLHIEQQHRKLAAIDMETYGLYFAAHESAQFVQHYFSVRCVVDLADKDKGDDLHHYGCSVSAQAAVRIINKLHGR